MDSSSRASGVRAIVRVAVALAEGDRFPPFRLTTNADAWHTPSTMLSMAATLMSMRMPMGMGIGEVRAPGR